MISFVRFFSAAVLALLFPVVYGAVPVDTQIGVFGPLNSFQPVNNWIYPVGPDIPVEISLGNGSLAFYCLHTVTNSSNFGFQMTYGLMSTSAPNTFMMEESITVPIQAQFFNFTGNLLSNTFWWNPSLTGVPAGDYMLMSSASFFACSQGSANGIHPLERLTVVRHDIYW